MAFVLFLLNTEWAEESLVLTVRIKTEEDRVAGQMFVVVSATFWFGLFWKVHCWNAVDDSQCSDENTTEAIYIYIYFPSIHNQQ